MYAPYMYWSYWLKMTFFFGAFDNPSRPLYFYLNFVNLCIGKKKFTFCVCLVNLNETCELTLDCFFLISIEY